MKQTIFFCSILVSFLIQRLDAQVGQTAVCFLTRQPAMQTIDFAQTLTREGNLDVFIAIDNNAFKITSLNISPFLRLIHIPNEQSQRAGYHQTIYLPRISAPMSSWDKALFYFNVLSRNYSFVWLIEEDVFIPSTRALLSLHRLYASTADLVLPSNTLNRLGNVSTWHWHLARGRFPPPWASSMSNVVGLSRRLLDAVDEFVRWQGSVPFHEFFFNTLALHHNLTIVTPTELSTVVYRSNYPFDAIKRQPSNLFHPVKDLRLQNTWRQRSVIHQQSNAAKKLVYY